MLRVGADRQVDAADGDPGRLARDELGYGAHLKDLKNVGWSAFIDGYTKG